MDESELGLFQMPTREATALFQQRLPGRNREVWARTSTAEVTMIDVEAVREAATEAHESTMTI